MRNKVIVKVIFFFRGIYLFLQFKYKLSLICYLDALTTLLTDTIGQIYTAVDITTLDLSDNELYDLARYFS